MLSITEIASFTFNNYRVDILNQNGYYYAIRDKDGYVIDEIEAKDLQKVEKRINELKKQG